MRKEKLNTHDNACFLENIINQLSNVIRLIKKIKKYLYVKIILI